jgi:hypothetical protein
MPPNGGFLLILSRGQLTVPECQVRRSKAFVWMGNGLELGF